MHLTSHLDVRDASNGRRAKIGNIPSVARLKRPRPLEYVRTKNIESQKLCRHDNFSLLTSYDLITNNQCHYINHLYRPISDHFRHPKSDHPL